MTHPGLEIATASGTCGFLCIEVNDRLGGGAFNII